VRLVPSLLLNAIVVPPFTVFGGYVRIDHVRFSDDKIDIFAETERLRCILLYVSFNIAGEFDEAKVTNLAKSIN